MPDYRDGRDIRAFTPVFDGLLPGHDEWELPRVLPCLRRTRAATMENMGKNALVQRDGVLYRGLSHD